MKQCNRCGKPLKDEAVICPDCGVPCSTKTGNPLHISDVGNCVAGENTVKNIEQQVANYYNNTYLGAKPGKYVVLHYETSVSGNVCNVVVRYRDGKESDGKVTYTPIADVAVNMLTGDCTIRSKPIKRTVERTAAHRVICVIAVLVLLNIVFIPFLSNEDGLIVDRGNSVSSYSFSDMVEKLEDGKYSNIPDDVIPIDFIYYIACPMCVLCAFIGALAKSRSTCIFGSVCGLALSVYLFYQVYLGETRWYIVFEDAHLTFGYYISCEGFIALFIASLCQKQ